MVRVDSAASMDGLQASEVVAAAGAPARRHPPQATLLSTPLGDGVVHSSLRPAEALSVFEDLQKARKGLRLDTELHLIFLATPASSGLEPDWPRFLSYYERLQPRDRAVADAVGVSHNFLVKQSMGHRGPLGDLPATGGGAPPGAPTDWRQERERIAALHRRFWAALALRELAAEAAPSRVAAAFAVPRGALQALQGLAATYCGMVRQLCERLRWHEMAALFDCLTPRLNFGVCPEGQPLCRIAGVYPARARALLEAGLTTVEAVANASVASVEVILRKLSQFESHRSDAEAARRQEVVVRQTAMKIVRGAQDRLGELLQNLEDEAEEEQLRVRRAISGTG
ncbi:unnamed protein product [Polarella glacialis]|uniref:POLQ-like helical domain-containing protein n=1 Tax=Polarella glacialis TaxID=89957 RepID=A0A813KFJ4_POLGL|nr:unnamed protein product [Polarella glacialis]